MSVENNNVEFFAQLYEALEDDTPDVPALRRFLEEQGIDVNETVSNGRRLFADYKKRRRLLAARRKLERVRQAVRKWSGSKEPSPGKIMDQIARALTGDRGDIVYQTYYRRLEGVDRIDLQSLHDDATLLEFIARVEVDDAE